MRIALDMDGVTCNLHDPWYARYNRDYGDNMTNERVVSWDTHLYVKEECGKKIYDYLKNPDLYDDVKPVEGALEGVQALRALGHELLFTTACGSGGGTMVDQKAKWLYDYGFVEKSYRTIPAELVIVEDKLWIDADVLIDDRAETVDRWIEEKRLRAILFEYPHNRWLLNEKHSAFWLWCKVVKTWKEIERYAENGL